MLGSRAAGDGAVQGHSARCAELRSSAPSVPHPYSIHLHLEGLQGVEELRGLGKLQRLKEAQVLEGLHLLVALLTEIRFQALGSVVLWRLPLPAVT